MWNTTNSDIQLVTSNKVLNSVYNTLTIRTPDVLNGKLSETYFIEEYYDVLYFKVPYCYPDTVYSPPPPVSVYPPSISNIIFEKNLNSAECSIIVKIDSFTVGIDFIKLV